MEEKGHQQFYINSTDKKFEGVCNAVFDVGIIVSKPIESRDVLIAKVGQAHNYEGLCILIMLDEDTKDHVDTLNW
jgi:hypothetical protein